jgi:hypothetical protein
VVRSSEPALHGVQFEASQLVWPLIFVLASFAAGFGLFLQVIADPPDRAVNAQIGVGFVVLGIALVVWAGWWGLPSPAVVVTPDGIRDMRRRHVIAWPGVRSIDVAEVGRLGIPRIVLTLTDDEHRALVARDPWPLRACAPLDKLLIGRTVMLLPLGGPSTYEIAGWLETCRRAAGRAGDRRLAILRDYYGRVRAFAASLRLSGHENAARAIDDTVAAGATSATSDEVLHALVLVLERTAAVVPAHRTEALSLAGQAGSVTRAV